MTIVIPEDGLRSDIWTAATGMRESIQMNPPEEGHIDIEIFEWDGDLTSATLEAQRRALTPLPPTEVYQSILHDHLVMVMKSGLLVKGASIETSKPSPLEKKDIMDVFLKVVKRPEYDGYVLSVHDKNGEPVRLHVDKET